MKGRNHNITIEKGGNRNPNQYRSPFDQPQILQRERRNNDGQNIQPPLHNNYVNEQDEHEIVEFDNEMHLFGEGQSTSFLTQYDYEVSLTCNQFDEDIEENGCLSYSIYRNDEQQRYNLQTKPIGIKQNT